jgi:hypothetical protein
MDPQSRKLIRIRLCAERGGLSMRDARDMMICSFVRPPEWRAEKWSGGRALTEGVKPASVTGSSVSPSHVVCASLYDAVAESTIEALRVWAGQGALLFYAWVRSASHCLQAVPAGSKRIITERKAGSISKCAKIRLRTESLFVNKLNALRPGWGGRILT